MSIKTLSEITANDMADLAALLSLLGDHPTVDSTPTLQGAVHAIQRQYRELWESMEQISESS